MDAHWVHVLDRADDDHVVVEVAHDFEFELFPAGYAAFYENAADGAGVEAIGYGAAKVFWAVGGGAALATEGEAGADYEGEADLAGKLQGFLGAVDDAALRYPEADTFHRLAEELSVLGLANRGDRSSEQLDAVLV